MSDDDVIDDDGVLKDGAARPAGAVRPAAFQPVPAVRTALEFLGRLEDGAFMANMTDSLNDLNAKLNDHMLHGNKKAKGKITITIDFTLEKGVFDIEAEANIKTPKQERGRTVMWSTPDNHFSLEHPRQLSMFPRRAENVTDIKS